MMLSFLWVQMVDNGLSSSPVRSAGLSFSPGLTSLEGVRTSLWAEFPHEALLSAPWRMPARFKAHSLDMCPRPMGCICFRHHQLLTSKKSSLLQILDIYMKELWWNNFCLIA